MQILGKNCKFSHIGFPNRPRNWAKLVIGVFLIVGNTVYIKIEETN